jgi:hypothetical protein
MRDPATPESDAGDEQKPGEAEAAEQQPQGPKLSPVLKRQWLNWGHAWCHEGVLERRKSIAATLQDFAAAG